MNTDVATGSEKAGISISESVLIILSLLVFGSGSTVAGSAGLYASVSIFVGFLWIILSIGYLYRTRWFSSGISIDAHLSKTALFWIWLGGVINPGITGFITLLAWQKEAPIKARRANIILMSIVVVEFVLGTLALVSVLLSR